MNIESCKVSQRRKINTVALISLGKLKTKDRVGDFRKVTPVRSKEPGLQEAKSSLWLVRVGLLCSHRHQVGATQGHTEVHLLLEYYMRSEGGSIQDEMPEEAEIQEIQSPFKMPLKTNQRHSKTFTHSTFNFFPHS